MCEVCDCRVIASANSWIEGEAVRQLKLTAALPGMKRAVGMPDLHPGKGTPIGAAFHSEGVIYPHLVGNDIGCGMGLWQTDLSLRKFKLDRAVKKLAGLEGAWDGDAEPLLRAGGLPASLASDALGTIGGGNHFAELQRADTVVDKERFEALGLCSEQATLLVHSGSRGLGEAILRRHAVAYGAEGLSQGSVVFDEYITRHNQAVAWAVINRAVIADRFMAKLGCNGTRALDICHNSVLPKSGGGWLHRKGAAPSDGGPVVIPGSRGAITYLVEPVGTGEKALQSLAHGAGRKWKRSDAKDKLQGRYKAADLVRTKLGGRVICEDKALIFEEAPEAYKDIEIVISDLENEGLIKVIATYKPLITYKTRRT